MHMQFTVFYRKGLKRSGLIVPLWDHMNPEFSEALKSAMGKRNNLKRVALTDGLRALLELMGARFEEATDHFLSPDPVRTEAALRDGKACLCCGSRRSLLMHHGTYERYGKELAGDLFTLCASCHYELHAAYSERHGEAVKGDPANRTLLPFTVEYIAAQRKAYGMEAAGGMAMATA